MSCHSMLVMSHDSQHVSHVTFDGGRLAHNMLGRCLQHVGDVLATS